MLFVRSLLFNIAFYLVTILMVTACVLVLPAPQRYVIRIGCLWGKICAYMFTFIVGGSYEIRNFESLPQDQSLMLASKHMSVFETFALIPLVKNPLFILKRELLWIPLFGWAVAKADMIPINRGARQKALTVMLQQAREKVTHRCRQLIIFPEGTRRPVDAEPLYKYGVASVYQAMNVPVYPVALNTGLFWPRRTFLRYPGKIIIEILPPIQPGMKAKEFYNIVSTVIEENSQRLIAEARADNPDLQNIQNP